MPQPSGLRSDRIPEGGRDGDVRGHSAREKDTGRQRGERRMRGGAGGKERKRKPETQRAIEAETESEAKGQKDTTGRKEESKEGKKGPFGLFTILLCCSFSF